MTNRVEQLSHDGPDWPIWHKEQSHDKGDESVPYWLTRFRGHVYELDVRPGGCRVFQWRPGESRWLPHRLHDETLRTEPSLALDPGEIMTNLPDYLMEWLL